MIVDSVLAGTNSDCGGLDTDADCSEQNLNDTDTDADCMRENVTDTDTNTD